MEKGILVRKKSAWRTKMNSTLERDIDAFIEKNRENIIDDIGRLVAVRSVEGPAEEGAPFGAGPRKALDTAVEIAGRLGLEAGNYGDRMGWAQVRGQSGDKYVATITHLDVVPEGDGWSSDPYKMRRRDGYMIGRGVMDDKGPSVLCLYALKYLAEKNVPLRYTMRALLGTAEETGMGDVSWFLENCPAPAFAFSPDADFPVVNGEKGILQGKLYSKCALENIAEISGGFVRNAVPDKAQALIKADPAKLPQAPGISIAGENGMARITARGVAGHASKPEGTVNAIGVLVDYILDNGLAGADEEKFLRLERKLLSASDGSALGIAARDEVFTPLTIIGGMIGCEDGRIWQSFDCRYPTTTDGRTITDGILAAAEGCARAEIVSDAKPFYVEADAPAIRACVDSYNEVTGEGKKPFTIGGGTYARDFPFAVSFGPEHDDRKMPDFCGEIHSVDEAAGEADFMEALKIYILAMIKLQDIEL
jgi:predicted dipeptidase